MFHYIVHICGAYMYTQIKTQKHELTDRSPYKEYMYTHKNTYTHVNGQVAL
jgi:hypothetical protein